MGDNEETIIMKVPQYGEASFAQIIHQSLPYIKKQVSLTQSSLIVFAYEDTIPLQVLHLNQDEKEIKSLILGRHTQCPLRLTDPHVSLRHLVLILYPKHVDFQYQLIDLNSGAGFTVDDKPCSSVWANGTAFLRILKYNLIFIAPEQVDWNVDDKQIIQQLTERIYEGNSEPRFAAKAIEIEGPLQPKEAEDSSSFRTDNTSRINYKPPPVWLKDSTNEIPRAELKIHFQQKQKHILIDEIQLERGVLIGRYERCGIFFSSHDEYNPISRVHCLLISIHGVIYIIDTASTNGTTVAHQPIQQCALTQSTLIILAESLFISWSEV